MTGNRSLDEFVGGAAADGAEVEDPAPAAASDAAEPDATGREAETDPAGRETETTAAGQETGTAAAAAPVEPDAVEPMAETVAWSPAGGECTRCGEPAEERWRDGDELVCGGCKVW